MLKRLRLQQSSTDALLFDGFYGAAKLHEEEGNHVLTAIRICRAAHVHEQRAQKQRQACRPLYRAHAASGAWPGR